MQDEVGFESLIVNGRKRHAELHVFWHISKTASGVVGSLLQMMGEKALGVAKQVSDDFPQLSWSSLARHRLAVLRGSCFMFVIS